MKRFVAGAVLVVAVAAAAAVAGQERFRRYRGGGDDIEVAGNTPYDGRFVFARISYDSGEEGGGFYGRRRGGGPPWSHDYPRGDVHFMKILNEVTYLRPRLDGSNIIGLDDPELFNYPIAYMAEPGFWMPTESQAANLRTYLLKGGFIIFDDFRGYDWENLQVQMRRVLPDGRFVELDGTSAIFHSFFEIDDPLSLVPPYGGLPPSYWGIYENNDPKKRLLAIANVNNDISEYWEWSDTGYAPVDLSNEAYKFGVNYYIYGLTH
ncbi:MAG TPA: DUF4159 domain-containing protein [Vicinamibacterales bacterium]|nr:DUF4159 domain-containing protein [Vicinamibacterales bacterium]